MRFRSPESAGIKSVKDLSSLDIRTPQEMVDDFLTNYFGEKPETRQYLSGRREPEPSIGGESDSTRSGVVLHGNIA